VHEVFKGALRGVGSVPLRPDRRLVCCGILLVLGASAARVSVAGGTASEVAAADLTPAATLPASCQSVARAEPKTAAIWDALTSPPAAQAYNALGALHAVKSDVACAVAAFEAALRIDPASWEAHYNLALALIRQGKNAAAEEQLRKAIAEKPRVLCRT
jgi:Flp pilus assembly protein TadD